MAEPESRLPLPPIVHKADGSMRRVGVEIELTGLDIAGLSHLLAERVGGTVEEISPYEHRIHGDPAGSWSAELDFAYLKDRGRGPSAGDSTAVPLEEAAEGLLRFGAEQVVPFEIISPPLPMDRLDEVDDLIERLRRAGARGTGDGILYAFGLQLNPELPDTRPRTVTRYLQAFLCLYDWLRERARVDFTRRLTAYVDPFPTEYVRQVVDPGYHPSRERLIEDYLAANPTRNRALDLLPLLCHLDERRVRTAVPDPRVKPRPALHYRLPNSEVDRPGWGIHEPWRDWLQVEHLVAEPDRLRRLCAAYLEFLNRPLAGLVGDWTETVRPWLKPPEDL